MPSRELRRAICNRPSLLFVSTIFSILINISESNAQDPSGMVNNDGLRNQTEDLLDEDGFLGFKPGNVFSYADAVARFGPPATVYEDGQRNQWKVFRWDENPSLNQNGPSSDFRALEIWVTQSTHQWLPNGRWFVIQVKVGAAYSVRPSIRGITDNRSISAYVNTLPGAVSFHDPRQNLNTPSLDVREIVEAFDTGTTVEFLNNRLVCLSIRDFDLLNSESDLAYDFSSSRMTLMRRGRERFVLAMRNYASASSRLARERIADQISNGQVLVQGVVDDACRSADGQIWVLLSLPKWFQRGQINSEVVENDASPCINEKAHNQIAIRLLPGETSKKIDVGDIVVLMGGGAKLQGIDGQVRAGFSFLNPVGHFKKGQPISLDGCLLK